MRKQIGFTGGFCFHLLQIVYFLSSSNVASAAGDTNPFTPKAALVRYWNSQIRSAPSSEPSAFLLSKASPMTAVQAAGFAKLAASDSLSAKLPAFCSAAGLLCFPDLSPSLEKHTADADFVKYVEGNFSNYGTGKAGGGDSFANYSDGQNLPVNAFGRYGRDSTGRAQGFLNYGEDGNVADQSFSGYAVGATGGKSTFGSYNRRVNVPNLVFGSYATDGNGQESSFTSYTQDTNSGSESFSGYGRDGNGGGNSFGSYGKASNVITSTFTGYGASANSANDSFTSYGEDGNVPENKFQSYGEGGNAGTLSFSSYRDKSNVGDDSFQSYGKKSNSESADFENYGKSFNEGSERFTGYGFESKNERFKFSSYTQNSTFLNYKDKKAASFSGYAKSSKTSSSSSAAMADSTGHGKIVNKWIEPGKFFRESLLKPGTVIPMPDIRDKMPKRSFLPRTIASKLPFSTSKLAELKRLFRAADNSSVAAMMAGALSECEAEPSRGEMKRCVGSAEDLIDFAISILGRNAVVRTTENVNGSSQDVTIGTVRGINGGRITQSVSCHQALYPYLLYYCHSVPKVRVYEADLLDPKTRAKINHGIAICHIDTSAWSPTHGAFLALGPGPGTIEVCHWIFENDMTWHRAD